MNKDTLNEVISIYLDEVKQAFEIVLGEHNQGQRKKLIRNEKVKPILERFGVNTEVE
jgi:hypothetical protein